MWLKICVFLTVAFMASEISAQQATINYRCRCLCPNTDSNDTKAKQYTGIDVLPNQCDCDNVVLPQMNLTGEKAQGYCLRCDCKYENRNTTIIYVVVIIVMWIISLLVVYMLFLICLDPLLNKRVQNNYTEHTNEEEMPGGSEGVSHAMGVRSNVLNRVGHQQDKWKRQVREQRRNIYDHHTMLN
ncbi:hypothetical protein ONE63_010291 [Megalurothrips usitatus]|uniref:Transmembrane protein 9 n=1 Tax=Megalurothrips usitatus TaxID=439358 RepID=A0AAV7XP24_9NEOP|nr:hypothetical protein ONE63_010291 [Megalurothrips usitatus]